MIGKENYMNNSGLVSKKMFYVKKYDLENSYY